MKTHLGSKGANEAGCRSLAVATPHKRSTKTWPASGSSRLPAKPPKDIQALIIRRLLAPKSRNPNGSDEKPNAKLQSRGRPEAGADEESTPA